MGYWKKLLPPFIWKPLHEIKRDYFPGSTTTYSGEGEDLILAKLFNYKKNGFYIDVGCYHPKINSNTYYFYQRGWSGVNIDASPDNIKKFNSLRKRDININIGISGKKDELTYYMFEESAINTFSEEMYQQRKNVPWVTFVGTTKVPTLPLRDVLSAVTLPAEIDFLDIDVEGLDLEVLKTNDWERVHPNVVMVEDQQKDISTFLDLESYRFLNSKGYVLIAKTFSTLVFVRHDFLLSIQ